MKLLFCNGFFIAKFCRRLKEYLLAESVAVGLGVALLGSPLLRPPPEATTEG